MVLVSTSSKLYRVKEGAVIAGVCQGLEVCGRGSAVAYRLLFFFGSIFWLIGIFIYIAMAISIPVATRDQVRRLREEAGEEDLPVTADALGDLEAALSKIDVMKSQGLISAEEAEKLRAKTLGI